MAFFVLTGLLILAAIFSGRDSLYYPVLTLSFGLSLFLLMRSTAEGGYLRSLLLQFPPTLVLGGSAVAMLLGHWYLVAPKLPISYLKILTVGLIVSILIRSGVLVETLWQASEQLATIRFFEIYGVFFLQRITLGLFLTLVLSILTYFCVKIRSTQSATGILYVVVVFCLVGEVIGSYLFQKTGLPL